MSCQGCHGSLGYGAFPEISSIIEPVQATSVATTMKRMKDAGREISPSDVTAMAVDRIVFGLWRYGVRAGQAGQGATDQTDRAAFGSWHVQGLLRVVLRNGVKTPAHGDAEMPVWGPLFRSMDSDPAIMYVRISSLVSYIKSLQVK